MSNESPSVGLKYTCDQGYRPVLPPVLEICVVWHPNDVAGKEAVSQIFDHFHETIFSGRGRCRVAWLRREDSPVEQRACSGWSERQRGGDNLWVPGWERIEQALTHLEKPLVHLDRFRTRAAANDGFQEQLVADMFS